MNYAYSRRDFLKSAAAVSAYGYLGFPFARAEVEPTLRLQVGIVSDTHLKEKVPAYATRLENALKLFSARNVDLVIHAGDITETSAAAEFAAAAAAWETAFPNNRAQDGREVQRIFITGNHDSSPANGAAILNTTETAAGKLTVNGYDFIYANWGSGAWGNLKVNYDQVKSLVEAEASGDKPFFYISHAALHETAFSAHASTLDANGKLAESTYFFECDPKDRTNPAYPYDGGRLVSSLLAAKGNCIALTGHVHASLTDETAFWGNGNSFSCVACSSTNQVSSAPDRENGWSWLDSSVTTTARKNMYFNDLDANGHSAQLDYQDAQHILIMKVYDDRVVFERLDLADNGAKLGPDWVVEKNAQGQFNAVTSRLSLVPQFAEGVRRATITKNALHTQKFACVSFPAVYSATGVRAYDYRVRYGEEEKICYAQGLLHSEAYDAETFAGRVVCKFKWNENATAAGVRVWPRNALGVEGEELSLRAGPDAAHPITMIVR